MEQPVPWVAELAEGRLEQLDDAYLTVGAVVRRAVYEGIGLAFAGAKADPPQAYEPRSLRYRQAFGLEDTPEPTQPTADQLADKRMARHKRNPGLDSLSSTMRRTPRI